MLLLYSFGPVKVTRVLPSIPLSVNLVIIRPPEPNHLDFSLFTQYNNNLSTMLSANFTLKTKTVSNRICKLQLHPLHIKTYPYNASASNIPT